MTTQFWKGKRVFLTGHTGFKGGWLALWLNELGVEVHGYALAPNTTPDLFTTARVDDALQSHVIGDIRDFDRLRDALQQVQPHVVFHLAAQPLVRYSYESPIETYATNVMGTVNLLEVVRSISSVKAVVNVTTDKCYENREWLWPYREEESLGGYDPYSSSKACSEIVTAAYRRSFLADKGIAVASARAGNVIGGGDWSKDRLIPDFLRGLEAGKPVIIRAPDSIRPWQHVLAPLSGYIALAESLCADPARYAEAWNFGPSEEDARPVKWILDRLVSSMPSARWEIDPGQHVHEASYLKLDSSKARHQLEWKPKWDLPAALDKIMEWHAAWKDGRDMHAVSIDQIRAYQNTKLAD